MDIQQFKEQIAEQRQLLVSHPLYSSIKKLRDVRIFMEHHVFAVWDFMSILKSLQQQLTCTTIPWLPTGDAKTRYLINEIVTGEESDVHPDGGYISHFELYLQAMKQTGCDTKIIENFVELIHDSHTPDQALSAGKAPAPAADFVKDTFKIIYSNKKHVLAAVFTFGREDLIPDMFISMVKELNTTAKDQLDTFVYYLERHIEVDGGHHSLLAYEMTSALCGNDDAKWDEALTAVRFAIESRIKFWDGIYEKIQEGSI